jgi:hypothetical protein
MLEREKKSEVRRDVNIREDKKGEKVSNRDKE